MAWSTELLQRCPSQKRMAQRLRRCWRACASSALLVVVSTTVGCGSSSSSSTGNMRAGSRCVGRYLGWCSDSWSKTYRGTLRESGFDRFVASCLDDESGFYKRGATRIPGKYAWYCTSRDRRLYELTLPSDEHQSGDWWC
uniref:Uncharacterized protein n=1 Tax=Alexandrium monilatum TaxID=311494 RepID=A0A7S4SNK0_9DINO